MGQSRPHDRRLFASTAAAPRRHRRIVSAPGRRAFVDRPGMLQRRIVDVLTDLCVTHLEMPVTPEHVWRVIREQVQPTRGHVMSILLANMRKFCYLLLRDGLKPSLKNFTVFELSCRWSISLSSTSSLPHGDEQTSCRGNPGAR